MCFDLLIEIFVTRVCSSSMVFVRFLAVLSLQQLLNDSCCLYCLYILTERLQLFVLISILPFSFELLVEEFTLFHLYFSVTLVPLLKKKIKNKKKKRNTKETVFKDKVMIYHRIKLLLFTDLSMLQRGLT